MSLRGRIGAAVKGFFGGGNATVVWDGGKPRVTPNRGSQFDQSTIVHACLSSICEAFVVPPFVTGSTGTDGQDRYDPATDFAERMRRPVKGQLALSGSRMMKAAVADYRLTGNAYFEVVRDGAGDLAELHWIPSWGIEPKAVDGAANRLDHYDVRRSSSKVAPLLPRDVVHVADGIDPQNPLKGRSAMRCLLLQVMTDNEADAYSAEVIVNPAIAGWAVLPTGDKDPGRENAEYVEGRIQAKFGRGGRGGVFVPSFRADVKTIGFSPEQLALNKLRRIPEERISAVMNVPAIVAGLGAGLDRSTFANMEAAQRYFARYGMLPLWITFAAEFTAQLPEAFGKGERAAFDTTKVPELQEDVVARWDRYTEAWTSSGITRGEYRQGLGLAARAGDEVFYADVAGAGGAAQSSDQLKARLKDRRRASEALAKQQADDAPAT